jgi:hypothetical protein
MPVETGTVGHRATNLQIGNRRRKGSLVIESGDDLVKSVEVPADHPEKVIARAWSSIYRSLIARLDHFEKTPS